MVGNLTRMEAILVGASQAHSRLPSPDPDSFISQAERWLIARKREAASAWEGLDVVWC